MINSVYNDFGQKVCYLCGEVFERFDKHHMSYKRVGALNEELDIYEVCHICHGDFHERHYYDKRFGMFRKRKKTLRLEDIKGSVLINYDKQWAK